jgi:hypothetical protein
MAKVIATASGGGRQFTAERDIFSEVTPREIGDLVIKAAEKAWLGGSAPEAVTVTFVGCKFQRE